MASSSVQHRHMLVMPQSPDRSPALTARPRPSNGGAHPHRPGAPPGPITILFILPHGPALALSCLSIPCGKGQVLAVLSRTVEFRLGGHHKSSSILAPTSTAYSISIVFSSQLSALFRRSPLHFLRHLAWFRGPSLQPAIRVLNSIPSLS